ncbi:RNA polymerase sigma-I factor [Lentibacillus sp. CBA3610]|uniref:RNA polymerase sigma-I factor n=1 Tax=Lentibacillus sp. CBA3610 TaxID=2518176 RepID=UPI001595888B|nr:RNA polymerase sigma-I factor [Lentibacillus sp. CBA3610]QKY68476.1 RNA polymerase sigma-I factor [Lentibacillus sp. CBA3610]
MLMSDQPLTEIPLEDMIVSAQEGDYMIQNYLLKSYQPFIAKSVSEVCKRYIDPKTDDEFSVGLNAFNEAIMSYCPGKGSSFLAFAKLVVKRKVIDYIRYVQKTPVAVSLDENYDEEQMENPVEVVAVKAYYREAQNTWNLREEILDFKEKLRSYKLSLIELTEVSPKHKDARETAISVARILHNDEKLRAFVQKKKKLPLKNLANQVNVSKKTLERNRKFILAIFIILEEDYTYLKEYLKGVG